MVLAPAEQNLRHYLGDLLIQSHNTLLLRVVMATYYKQQSSCILCSLAKIIVRISGHNCQAGHSHSPTVSVTPKIGIGQMTLKFEFSFLLHQELP